MTSNENSKTFTVAYAPFKTFLSAIEVLEQGVPDNINRTVWPSYSGVMISQVLGAFRFLGLINQDGTPTENLHVLVSDADNRKATLRGIIARSYTKLAKRSTYRAAGAKLKTRPVPSSPSKDIGNGPW